MQGITSNDTSRKQQAIRRKVENGIRLKFEARFFLELVLAVVAVGFAMVGIAKSLKGSAIDNTFWVAVVMIPAFVLLAVGAWKYADMRQAELYRKADEALREFRQAFGLEF